MSKDGCSRKEGESAGRGPLPKQILRLREYYSSVFVSNLPPKMSITEVKAKFFWAGRIVNIYLPKVRSSRDTRGFAFVRFATCREAEKAIELAEGRSWGGHKIQVNMEKFHARKVDTMNR